MEILFTVSWSSFL